MWGTLQLQIHCAFDSVKARAAPQHRKSMFLLWRGSRILPQAPKSNVSPCTNAATRALISVDTMRQCWGVRCGPRLLRRPPPQRRHGETCHSVKNISASSSYTTFGTFCWKKSDDLGRPSLFDPIYSGHANLHTNLFEVVCLRLCIHCRWDLTCRSRLIKASATTALVRLKSSPLRFSADLLLSRHSRIMDDAKMMTPISASGYNTCTASRNKKQCSDTVGATCPLIKEGEHDPLWRI